jgi:tRNA nucleotidyltransferase (CCA-adding enzyme)
VIKHAMDMASLNTRELPESLLFVCQHIASGGGKAWLVGGCVRDLLLGIRPKDFDIEVYGLKSEQLERILAPLGKTEFVGRRFGVIKLWLNNMELDIALPRTELKTADGHRGFSVESNPNLSPETATLRRDFTINAMMFDPLDNKLLDFHGGQDDLANKKLRHVSPAFIEDPLRPLRAVQFAARFQLKLTKKTAELCRLLLAEADTLPESRVWGEWQKWSHAPYPSYGLLALQESGWLSLYPELAALVACKQDERWHPEGDVWVHTLQVCDMAAVIANQNKLDFQTREHLLFAALCHDLGKPSCTFADERNNLRSPGHCEAGVKLSERSLQQIGAPKSMAQFILPLVREHMTHMHGEPTDRAVRRLSHRLEPTNIELWEMLVEADASGRMPAPASRPALVWLEKARNLEHQHASPTPLVTGKLLMTLGIKPGPEMGKLIQQAYEAQLNGDICDNETAQNWCRKKSNN